MLSTIVELAINITAYTLFIFGLYLLCGRVLLVEPIREFLTLQKSKKRSKALKEKMIERTEEQPKKRTRLYYHLEDLLQVVLSNSKPSVHSFIFLITTIFAVSFTFLILFVSDVLVALLMSVLVASLPYIFLYLRLITLRNQSGYAFLEEFHIIFQNYHISNNNMYSAILKSLPHIKNKHLKKLLMQLSYRMSMSTSSTGLERATQLFAFAINTTFSTRFSKLVYSGYVEQRNVSETLKNLNNDIDDMKMRIEERKTARVETIGMGYISLASPIAAFFLVYALSGVVDFWHYFFSPDIFTLFIVCCFTALFSFLVAFAKRKPKADI